MLNHSDSDVKENGKEAMVKNRIIVLLLLIIPLLLTVTRQFTIPTLAAAQEILIPMI